MLLISLMLCGLLPARAGDAVDRWVLEAQARSPEVAAARASWDEGLARVPRAIDDPSVDARWMGMDASGELELMVMQQVAPAGSLKAERDADQAAVDAAEADLRGAELAVEARVREAGAMWAGALERRRHLVGVEEAVAAQSGAARAMIASGMGALSDVAMADMEAAEIKVQLAEIDGEIAQWRAKLTTWTGESPTEITLGEPAALTAARVVPMVQAMQAMERMAQADEAMARRMRSPMWMVGAGAQVSMGSAMPMLRVEVPLPVGGREREAVAVGEARAARASASTAQATQDSQLELAELRARVDALRVTLAAAQEMEEATTRAGEAALAAYAHGSGTMEAYLTTSHRLHEAVEMRWMTQAELVAMSAMLANMSGHSLLPEGT